VEFPQLNFRVLSIVGADARTQERKQLVGCLALNATADVFEPTLKLKVRFCSVPKRILIADDHESVLRRVRAMLEFVGPFNVDLSFFGLAL
jgi:PleD family two-component response regulator